MEVCAEVDYFFWRSETHVCVAVRGKVPKRKGHLCKPQAAGIGVLIVEYPENSILGFNPDNGEGS